jgi:hypothetical protein
MSNLRIKASLSGGTLTITGSGFVPNATAVIQTTRRATGATVRSPPAHVDGDGNFSVTAPFCGEEGVGPGVYDISATTGRPQKGHEDNTEWSNNVAVTCGGSPSEEEEEPHEEEEVHNEVSNEEVSNEEVSNEEAEPSPGEEGEEAPADEGNWGVQSEEEEAPADGASSDESGEE